jgi:hypothetical protein
VFPFERPPRHDSFMRWLGSMPIREPRLVRANIMAKPRGNEDVAPIHLCNLDGSSELGQRPIAQLQCGKSDALETLWILIVPKRQVAPALGDEELRYRLTVRLEK